MKTGVTERPSRLVRRASNNANEAGERTIEARFARMYLIRSQLIAGLRRPAPTPRPSRPCATAPRDCSCLTDFDEAVRKAEANYPGLHLGMATARRAVYDARVRALR